MMKDIRAHSVEKAQQLGYPTNPGLPYLDDNEAQSRKDVSELADRILCLSVVVACACGWPRPKAQAWLEKEGLTDCLTESEQAYLESNSGPRQDAAMQWHVEAIWTLAWYLGLHNEFDFSDSCADHLVKLLPDIKNNASTESFRKTLNRRSREELLEQLDLAYCLHWAVRDVEIRGQRPPGRVPPNVVVERRHALEWMAGQDAWDEVSLDT